MSVLTDSNNINFEVCHYVCYFAKNIKHSFKKIVACCFLL